MNYHSIEISGVTPASHFPQCLSDAVYLQSCETDTLWLPCQKPDMETILQLFIEAAVCSSKIICTPLGRKLIVHGVKRLKIMYVAAETRQTVHSAHFDLPFSLFLLLRDEHLDVTEVSTLIEDISVLSVDCRSLTVSTLLFTYASIKEKQEFCSCHEKPLPPSHSCHPKVQHFNCGHTPVKGTCLVCGEHKKENAHNAPLYYGK